MATVRSSNFDWNGQPYWGLVQQKGPWSSTPGDIKRAKEKDFGTFGGGIGVGGTGHRRVNGNANFAAFINPYQVNATGAPPPPSGYARPTVMMAPIEMKRATKMGKAKQGLTLAARTPLQTGQKMGKSREETTQTEPGDIMPPTVVEGTTQFSSTHHIMEMPRTREIGMLTRPGGRSIGTMASTVISDNGDDNQEINPGNTFHILPVDPIYPSQPAPSSPAALPYSNIYPTLPSPVLPYTDQMVASTINRDFERQAVMGRQIESIDSNYREAEQFTGEEMRAATSTTNVIRDALRKLAEDQGVPVEVIYQQAEQYTLPGQEIRQSTETNETEKKIKELVRKYTAKKFRAVLNNLKPVFGPEEAPPGTRRSTGLTAKQSRQNLGRLNVQRLTDSQTGFGFKGLPGENLLGTRMGTRKNENKSAPKRFDELPDRKTRSSSARQVRRNQ